MKENKKSYPVQIPAEDQVSEWGFRKHLKNAWKNYDHIIPNSMMRTIYSTRVYPKVSGLAASSENCNWYSYLPLGALISLFSESVYWVFPP
jgi:hypothetical protein